MSGYDHEHHLAVSDLARQCADFCSKLAAAETELTSANSQMRELGRQLAEAGEARIAAEAREAQLRERMLHYASNAYREGFTQGMKEFTSSIGGESRFNSSRTFAAINALTASPSDYRERVRREERERIAKVADERVLIDAQTIRALGDSNAPAGI